MKEKLIFGLCISKHTIPVQNLLEGARRGGVDSPFRLIIPYNMSYTLATDPVLLGPRSGWDELAADTQRLEFGLLGGSRPRQLNAVN